MLRIFYHYYSILILFLFVLGPAIDLLPKNPPELSELSQPSQPRQLSQDAKEGRRIMNKTNKSERGPDAEECHAASAA